MYERLVAFIPSVNLWGTCRPSWGFWGGCTHIVGVRLKCQTKVQMPPHPSVETQLARVEKKQTKKTERNSQKKKQLKVVWLGGISQSHSSRTEKADLFSSCHHHQHSGVRFYSVHVSISLNQSFYLPHCPPPYHPSTSLQPLRGHWDDCYYKVSVQSYWWSCVTLLV